MQAQAASDSPRRGKEGRGGLSIIQAANDGASGCDRPPAETPSDSPLTRKPRIGQTQTRYKAVIFIRGFSRWRSGTIGVGVRGETTTAPGGGGTVLPFAEGGGKCGWGWKPAGSIPGSSAYWAGVWAR